jgi:acetyl-CoA carboxylase biotin carboxyl carrier protein
MDLARIEELIQVVQDARVSELTLRADGTSVTVRKAAAAPHGPKAPKKKQERKQEAPKKAQAEDIVITAPMVGIFHASSASVRPGALVKPGQVVGSIESMKLMNDVVAQVGGTIAELAVDDGLPVEFGQVLYRLEQREAEE